MAIRGTFQYVLFIQPIVNLAVYIGNSKGELFATIQRGDTYLLRVPIEVDAITLEQVDAPFIRSTDVPTYKSVTVQAYLSDIPISSTVVHYRPPSYDESSSDSTLGEWAFSIQAHTPVSLAGVGLMGRMSDNLKNAAGWSSMAGDKSAALAGLYQDNHVGVVALVGADNGNPLAIKQVNMVNGALSFAPVIVAQPKTFTLLGELSTSGHVPLSHIYAAAGAYQYLTLWHALAGVKTVRVVSCQVALVASSAASTITAQMVRLLSTTVPVTGNPALVTSATETGIAAPETVALCLPTTQGAESGRALTFEQWRIGATPASPATNPPQPLYWSELVPRKGEGYEYEPPKLRPGFDEGWCVRVHSSVASTVDMLIRVVFTEE